MDIVTGRAEPPSHGPTYNNPRRLKSPHVLVPFFFFTVFSVFVVVFLEKCSKNRLLYTVQCSNLQGAEGAPDSSTVVL